MLSSAELEEKYQVIRKNLEARNYTVSLFPDAEAAASYLRDAIAGKTVGFGDSETLASMHLYDILSERCTVYDPMHRGSDGFVEAARRTLLTDIFLTSVNGAAETGELVNIDGTGNRVAGSLFGHEKVYFVFGRNKIAATLEEARKRARNFAAPLNAARHRFATPCAMAPGGCRDCSSPDRICNAEIIHYRKMRFIDMEVIIIDQDLGL